MPTLILLAIAFQLQNKKWRYLFLILSALKLIISIYNHEWLLEYYSFTGVTLLFMLNAHFSIWWKNRNSRNNPSSFLDFSREIYWVAKKNIITFLGLFIFFIVAVFLVSSYTSYTGYVLLGCILFIFIIFFVIKNVINLLLPPEWFLHDISTRFVFLAVIIACIMAHFIYLKLGNDFIIPMMLAVIFSLIGFYCIKISTRYFMPGCSLILSDLSWQIIRALYEVYPTPPEMLIAQLILIIAMMVGLLWLVKKPGFFPILFLLLFQLFRLSGFIGEALVRLVYDHLPYVEVMNYILYLICWMYIVPFLFWLVVFLNQDLEPPHEAKIRPNLNKLLYKNDKQTKI